MSRIVQIEQLLLRSRRLPWLVLGVVFTVLAFAIFITARQVRSGLRQQILNRDADVLHAVLVARLDAMAEGELREDVREPGTQLAALLVVSRLKGVVGIRLFDSLGRFVESISPAPLREVDVPAPILDRLIERQPVGVYFPHSALNQEFYADQETAPDADTTLPMLSIYVPLHTGTEPRPLGMAQFLIDGSTLSLEFRKLDQHLLYQGVVSWVSGAALLTLALGWAFRQIQMTHRQLAQRTQSLLYANAELALAARTTALGAVASHLVHGLKSPLAGLQNLVAVATATTANQELAPGPEDWAQAAASMRRMHALIQEVIQVLREQPAGDQYQITLAELATLATQRLGTTAAAAGVRIDSTCAADASVSNRTANLLLLILTNLLENAVQASVRGQSVLLRITGGPGNVRCAVEDQGAGIPPELRNRLFSPLASPKEGGSGLGLAISKQLANHLGADLCLVETGDLGTRFEIRLPDALLEDVGAPHQRPPLSGAVAGLLLMTACTSTTAAWADDARWRWSHPEPHGNNVVDMAWSPSRNIWVQVTELGQLYTHRDGSPWIPRESGTRRALRGVTFFGDRILVTGEAGTVLYADTEATFRAGTLLNGPTTDWLEGVAASSTLAVAVGDGGAVYTSTNGVDWTRGSSGVTNSLRGVTFGNNQFVAVGERGTILASPDGRNWSMGSSGTLVDLNRVSFSGASFLATGDAGVTRLSLDGLSWMTQTTGAARDLFTTAATDTDAVVAGDLEFRTRTGFQWTNELVLLDGPPPWTYLASVGRSNSFFVAGRTGMMVEGYRAGPPPFDWVLRSSPLRPWLFDLAWVTNLYVAVGDQSTIMTSVDGVRWSYEFPPPSFTNTIFLGVGGTTNLLVAAGSAGALMISPHAWIDVISTNQLGTVITQQVSTLGVVWQAVEPRPTTNDLQGVCSWNGRYYVSGHQGQVLSSPDGTNWTSQTSATQSFLSGITGFSGGLIAVGDDGALVMSTNGTDWVNVPIGTTNWLYKVRWLDDRLIVVGQNGSLFTSSDGVNWQPGATGSAAWLTDAAWIDNHYYAVGLNGTVLRSPDAITWTNLSTITLKSLYAAAADTNHLLVAGVEGVILRSPVVPDTDPIEILAFSHTNGTNSPNWQSLFLFGGKPDQQFTLDRRSGLGTNTWITGPKLEFLDASGTLFYLETVAASNAPLSEFYRATLIQ